MDKVETWLTQLRAMRDDLHRLDATSKKRDLDRVLDYIETADLRQCGVIVGSLIDRVARLVGCAPELEDAYCSIARELEE